MALKVNRLMRTPLSKARFLASFVCRNWVLRIRNKAALHKLMKCNWTVLESK